ncbi:uncharacterized protein BT62DRAFT_939262, partial [Guyanagaster necrorhizus]
ILSLILLCLTSGYNMNNALIQLFAPGLGCTRSILQCKLVALEMVITCGCTESLDRFNSDIGEEEVTTHIIGQLTFPIKPN